jgi:integrase
VTGDHRLYDCRHTAATLLLGQGVHPRVVMDVLGHSTFRLTMDTYSHVMPAVLREAAEATERALRKSTAAAFGGQFGGHAPSL